ncbi:hypothetical protein M5K25_015400 [Dendrobium thyrsiflorum]|uniref:Uncharacterized protein n=1 Tax=Dendrobium thyrsiflorum TaxID=117978 RepID=A0ABD0UQ59_DENTH
MKGSTVVVGRQSSNGDGQSTKFWQWWSAGGGLTTMVGQQKAYDGDQATKVRLWQSADEGSLAVEKDHFSWGGFPQKLERRGVRFCSGVLDLTNIILSPPLLSPACLCTFFANSSFSSPPEAASTQASAFSDHGNTGQVKVWPFPANQIFKDLNSRLLPCNIQTRLCPQCAAAVADLCIRTSGCGIAADEFQMYQIESQKRQTCPPADLSVTAGEVELGQELDQVLVQVELPPLLPLPLPVLDGGECCGGCGRSCWRRMLEDSKAEKPLQTLLFTNPVRQRTFDSFRFLLKLAENRTSFCFHPKPAENRLFLLKWTPPRPSKIWDVARRRWTEPLLGATFAHISSCVQIMCLNNLAKCSRTQILEDGGGNDDRPDQDPMVPSSQAIMVPNYLVRGDSQPNLTEGTLSPTMKFETVGKHTRSDHDHNLIVSFGGKITQSEVPGHNRLPVVPFDGETTI